MTFSKLVSVGCMQLIKITWLSFDYICGCHWNIHDTWNKLLDLRNNLITTVEQLTFKNFTLLAWLRLSANSITSLPGFALHMPLTTLSHVYIDGNRIVSLNNFAFAGLRTHYMILNNNELTEFPCLSNITKLDNLFLYGNPISTVPTDCGQWWGKLMGLNLGRTRLASLDNITEYTQEIRFMHTNGVPVILSDDTFRNTPNLEVAFLRRVNQFPQFYSSKATLKLIIIEGRAVHCIQEEYLDGMNAVKTFKLWHTSVVQLPHPGCSNTSYENRTARGYFESLQNISIFMSNLEKLPSFHHSPQLFSMKIQYHRINTINDSEIPELKSLYEWNLYHGKLLHFPNLTSLGYNNSLVILQLGRNKISSVPCFPDSFKMNNLARIVLHYNRISYICSMDFAPNVITLNLTGNLLIGNIFVGSTNVPLYNLHTISARLNNMEQINDSGLHVIQSCQVLQMGGNKIKQFPNIKLIASTAVHIELLSNLIPDMPCAALAYMVHLVTLHLDNNIVSHICPLLHTMAPNLTYLGLSGNRLLEIPDLRMPPRLQTTRVILDGNPFRCLATLCWMLFVPKDSHLQLELGDTSCTDHENTTKNIFAGLSEECKCKALVHFSVSWSSSISVDNLREKKYPLLYSGNFSATYYQLHMSR